jgi:hypothetical protein
LPGLWPWPPCPPTGGEGCDGDPYWSAAACRYVGNGLSAPAVAGTATTAIAVAAASNIVRLIRAVLPA